MDLFDVLTYVLYEVCQYLILFRKVFQVINAIILIIRCQTNAFESITHDLNILLIEFKVISHFYCYPNNGFKVAWLSILLCCITYEDSTVDAYYANHMELQNGL